MMNPMMHPLRRMPGGVSMSIASIGLAGAVASAGALRPSPGASFQLTATAADCGDHAVCAFDTPSQQCGGTKGVFRPDCDNPTARTTSLALQPSQSGQAAWVEGIAASIGSLSAVNAVDPATRPPLLQASIEASRGPNTISFAFDAAHRPVASLIDPLDPVMVAWPGGSLAGLCGIGQEDELVASVSFDLDVDATVLLDGALAATDVRCNGQMWASQLSWTIASDTDPSVASCQAHAEVPDQQVTLQAERSPPVSVAAESHSRVALSAGSYTLTVRFSRGESTTNAAVNACQEMAGAWALQDTASFTLSMASPADLDNSGTVDFGDAAWVLLDYGMCADGCAADLDDSGEVDFGDVSYVLLDYGASTPRPMMCP